MVKWIRYFEIQRAYLGYQHQFSKTISGQLILDVGDPSFGNFQMTAYLKNAYMQYKKDKLTVKMGMIGLYQYKLQEDLWGGRYFYKSFMDEHKFGPSADLGAFVKYDFHKMVSADFTIANGEGYKKLESDSILKVQLGSNGQAAQRTGSPCLLRLHGKGCCPANPGPVCRLQRQ